MSYTFSRIKPRNRVRKAAADRTSAMVLLALRRFLDKNEPELVYFLVNLWHAQGKAITYKELREAILAGYLTGDLLEDWRQDYTRFVVEHLRPAWTEAMETAAAEIVRTHPGFYFDPYAEGVQHWCEAGAARFVTEVTSTQIEAIRAVVSMAANTGDMSVDQLARAIRPMVGLTHPQAVANMKYYTNLVEGGMSPERAKDLSIRYAARQHRYRGYNIARTELAFAYNQGSYEATKQAQEAGYMGEVVKIWSTADDERVCEICGGLEGKQVAMDDDFDFTTKLTRRPNTETIRRVPPAHPSCRCAVKYVEISPPARPAQPAATGSVIS